MKTIHRRDFLRRALVLGGGAGVAASVPSVMTRAAFADPPGFGYGGLLDRGELWLPPGFVYRVIDTTEGTLSNGSPTPTMFDGMATFPGPDNTTIVLRNHENRHLPFQVGVQVPPEKRYDPAPAIKGGVVKLVVSPDRRVVESYALMGGTSRNCSGGATPWGTWITCEEDFAPPGASRRHGYIFEVDAYATEPVDAVPIIPAGRFEHEAAVWHDGALYETEDRGNFECAFYRFDPAVPPEKAGDLAANGGTLWALRVIGHPQLVTRALTPEGATFDVDWVRVANPNPGSDANMNAVRRQAWAQGAARFWKLEGMAVSNGKIYFNASGRAGTAVFTLNGAETVGAGQIWELDPAEGRLKLLIDSRGPEEMLGPDNMGTGPTGDVFVCEDHSMTDNLHVRAFTAEGDVYPFARAGTYRGEFSGVCFDPDNHTMYVNQMGRPDPANPELLTAGTTYAIWGPWKRRGRPRAGSRRGSASALSP